MSRVRKTESEKKDPMNKSARTYFPPRVHSPRLAFHSGSVKLRNMDMFFFSDGGITLPGPWFDFSRIHHTFGQGNK